MFFHVHLCGYCLSPSLVCLKEPQRWTGRKESTAACAFTMESLRTSTGENITTMFNMLPTVSNFEVIQLTLLFQLSQFEDSRREGRDLSSTSQVRLQHLWRHWRRGSHYQVWFECSLRWSLCRPMICHVLNSHMPGIALSTRMAPSAVGQACLSWRLGGMPLAISHLAGVLLVVIVVFYRN